MNNLHPLINSILENELMNKKTITLQLELSQIAIIEELIFNELIDMNDSDNMQFQDSEYTIELKKLMSKTKKAAHANA